MAHSKVLDIHDVEKFDDMTSHIHKFRSIDLQQLVAARNQLSNEDAIHVLMESVYPKYCTLVTSLRRQPNLSLQSLILDLIQEEIFMNDMTSQHNSIDSQSALNTHKRNF